MKIQLSSVMVDDQDKAIKFYTEVLGFVKKRDIPMGPYRWLTVVAPEGPGDIELLLQPMGFSPAKTFQRALFDAGNPLTAFATDDIHGDCNRMKALGISFRGEPMKTGPVMSVLFEDTCGNLINLYQP